MVHFDYTSLHISYGHLRCLGWWLKLVYYVVEQIQHVLDMLLQQLLAIPLAN